MANNLRGGVGSLPPGAPLIPPPAVPPTPAPAAPAAPTPPPPPPPLPAAPARGRRAGATPTTPVAPAAPAAPPAPAGGRWAWTAKAAPHLPVVLTGLALAAVYSSTWSAGAGETVNWVRDAVVWAWRHAQALATGAFLAAVAYAYTPWREVGGYFRRNVSGAWSWRVVGFYAAGLAAGTGTLLLCLEVGGDSRWMQAVGVLDMVAVVSVFALAAHWQPGWEAPPALVGAWVGGFMLLVPGWLALCNLASKF